MPCDFARSAILSICFVFPILTPSLSLVAQQEPRESVQATPENAIDRWNRMSPEERERELAKLPPARAKLIRQRIRRYNQMHPEEQQALRQRYQTFSQLPPAKQQVIRERLREFRQLPPARQPVVHREVQQLRRLPEPQRQARLNSDDFRGRFSPAEQNIIRDLSTYLPD